MRVIAQQDLPRLHRFGIGHNRQPRAAHAFEVTLQFLGSVAFGWDGIGSNDDSVAAAGFFGDGCRARARRAHNARHRRRQAPPFPMPMSHFGMHRSEKSMHNQRVSLRFR